ncbi:MAG TPA: hypothetical protein VF331_19540 [Polyangiales bacterium]
MTSMMRRSSGVCVMVLIAACGSNTSAATKAGDAGAGADAHVAGDSGVAAGPAIADLSTVLAPAVCGQVTQCFGGSFLAQSAGGPGCTAQLTAQLEDKTLAQLTAAANAGTIHYHAEKVGGCIANVKMAGCAITVQRLKDVPGCDGVFEGTIAVGSHCDVNDACIGQAYCKQANNACPGVCTALGAAGDSCNSSDECRNLLACSTAGTCAKPATVGQPCGLTGQVSCALGLLCSGADTAQNLAGKCTPVSAAFTAKTGESCDLQKQKYCVDGVACIAMLANATATFSCAAKVAAGASCHFAVPSQCPDTQYCNADLTKPMTDGSGTCLDLPKAGEACLPTAGVEGDCAPGLACAADQKCRALGRIGDACTGDSDCASERCDAGKCSKPAQCKL